MKKQSTVRLAKDSQDGSRSELSTASAAGLYEGDGEHAAERFTEVRHAFIHSMQSVFCGTLLNKHTSLLLTHLSFVSACTTIWSIGVLIRVFLGFGARRSIKEKLRVSSSALRGTSK